MDKFMDDIANFLKNSPVAIGLVVVLIGLFLFLGSVFNWNWIFGDISSVNYNPGKIDGLVNIFGRTTARVILGALSLFIFITGAVILWYCWTIKH